jgi:hypothetical protein
MNLQDYLRKSEVDVSLPRPVLEVFEATEPADLSEPLSQHRPALRLAEPEALVELVLTRYRWLAWRERVEAGLTDFATISREHLEEVDRADQVSAMARASAEGDAVVRQALFGVWTASMDVALDHSQLEVVMVQPNHPRAGTTKHLVGELGQLALVDSSKWLEIKRGLRNEVIALKWSHPSEAMAEASAEHLPALEEKMGGKPATDLIKKHVLPHLDSELEIRKSLLVDEEIARITAESYRTLLAAEGVRSLPLGAIFVGTDRQRVGMAILDKRGGVSATAPIRPSGKWAERAVRWMKDNKARMVVLPQTAAAQKWLDELAEAMDEASVRTHEIHPAGIIVARGIDDPTLKRVSPEEASAIVLARRAHRPLDEWTRLEPEKLGLAPFQSELYQPRFREVLQVVRERCIAQGQPMSTAPVTTGGIRGRSSAPLNPDITSIRDLRPGLSLNGIITNVTKFGAFVNLGLRQEGLVHISELSDEFVNEPTEVVQTGQRLTCRVISVDLDRGRIALSMRTEGAAAVRRPGGPGGPGGGGGGPRRDRPGAASQNPAERSRALADLESFFNK